MNQKKLREHGWYYKIVVMRIVCVCFVRRFFADTSKGFRHRAVTFVCLVALVTAVFSQVSDSLTKSEGNQEVSTAAVSGGSVSASVADSPTEEPTEKPIEKPTEQPTEEPSTDVPTGKPTEQPTALPTEKPTEEPTTEPTEEPSERPTDVPSEKPAESETEDVEVPATTDLPTEQPSVSPTATPTGEPSEKLSEEPTAEPTPLATATPAEKKKGEEEPTQTVVPDKKAEEHAVPETQTEQPKEPDVQGESAEEEKTPALPELPDEGIIRVELPTTSHMLINPMAEEEESQIVSERFPIRNHSDFTLEVELLKAVVDIKQSGGMLKKDCRLNIDVLRNEDVVVAVRNLCGGMNPIGASFPLQPEEHAELKLSGYVERGTEALWKTGDLQMRVVFTFRPAE